ncbi:Uncharacterised protein g5555 [Pycnogonum litorale]
MKTASFISSIFIVDILVMATVQVYKFQRHPTLNLINDFVISGKSLTGCVQYCQIKPECIIAHYGPDRLCYLSNGYPTLRNMSYEETNVYIEYPYPNYGATFAVLDVTGSVVASSGQYMDSELVVDNDPLHKTCISNNGQANTESWITIDLLQRYRLFSGSVYFTAGYPTDREIYVIIGDLSATEQGYDKNAICFKMSSSSLFNKVSYIEGTFQCIVPPAGKYFSLKQVGNLGEPLEVCGISAYVF